MSIRRSLATVLVAFALMMTVAPVAAAAGPEAVVPPPEAELFAEEFHQAENIVAMPDQPGLPETHRVRGRTVTKGVTYRNFFRVRMASFYISKYWEYDGRRIRSAPRPRVRANVTNFASGLGWDYNGVIGSGDHYYWWRGNSRSGHKSWRQGKFTFCPGPWGCYWKKYPTVTIWAHADGTYSRKVRG